MVGLILVFVVTNGQSAPKDGPVVAEPRSSSSSISSPPTSAAPTSSAASTTPTPSSGGATRAASATTTPKRVPLTVLNNSTETGLGKRAAAQFLRGGWRVVKVGNFTGRVAVTTVYFDRGQEAVAKALAAQFPGVRRVRPRFTGLPGSGLTVVVTREYPA